jgi:putative sporulation protein YtaF
MFQILFVTALCIDAFAASFTYGVEKTKIPLLSGLIISLICTLALGISISIGSGIKLLIPEKMTSTICFAVLFILGLVKSFDFLLKKYILNNVECSSHFKIKIFDLNFVLTVYADNLKADADNSKLLSPREAIYLAAALSFDSLGAGLGFAMTDVRLIDIILLSLVSNILAIFLGYLLGKFVSRISNIDFSWVSGILLLVLSISKLK